VIRPARRTAGTLLLALALVAAACGDEAGDEATTPDPTGAPATAATTGPTAGTGTVTLVAYDSFPVEGTAVNEALEAFTAETGIEVTILSAGDTGTMLSKAALTAGTPEGDVMWGVDSTFLSRAIEAEVFEPHTVAALDELDPSLLAGAPNGLVTPVDSGDVCVNVDLGWFAERDLEVPATFEDLADPAYAGLLVVQDPATSSPGLAFLLATVAEYGEDGWMDYWQRLVDNEVEVVSGWSEAYYERFTWAGGGPRPLVVSYGTSPPAEVIFADPPRDDAPTGVLTATCYRQVEYAGVLRGTDRPEEARALLDFLASASFQSTLPLDLFVYPANTTVELPDAFVRFAVRPEVPVELEAELVGARRNEWIDAWTELVLG
jgi:thiamine transport system substrate-binding protein